MPARRYEFRVAGRHSADARAAFADMADLAVTDVPPETAICGDIVDESQLYGVLAQIQNLGLRLVSVNQVRR